MSIDSLSVVLALPAPKAQFAILACKLIAVYGCFPKAVEVAFFELLSVNDMGDKLSETGITKGGRVIVGPPGDKGVFLPLFATLDAFYA